MQLKAALEGRTSLAKCRLPPKRPPPGVTKVDPHKLMLKWAEDPSDTRLPHAMVMDLLEKAKAFYEKQPGPVIDLSLPTEGLDPRLIIVGDTHGQLQDVLHILHTQGPPSESCIYLINGDISDRGPNAVEIWLLVLAFKLRLPNQVHILRGNHENEMMNERPREFGGGFAEECLYKYGFESYSLFRDICSRLPLFAVIQKEVFVVHGGLFRTPGVTLERLRKLSNWKEHYPMQPREYDYWTDEEAVLFDAQWADPHEGDGFVESPRGAHVVHFGRDVTEQFLMDNHLSLCIRSHQVPESGQGFEWSHGGCLLTVFSASNYGGRMDNRGAIAVLRPREATEKKFSPGGSWFDPVNRHTPYLLQNILLTCVEHWDMDDEASPILRQARQASKVSKEIQSTSVLGIDNASAEVAMRHSLGLIHYHRAELWERCTQADHERTGYVPVSYLETQLQDLCGEVDWDSRLRASLNLDAQVAYGNLLRAIRVYWLHLSSGQFASLTRALLRADLSLDALSHMFDINQDDVTRSPRTIRRAIKMLVPSLTEEQSAELKALFGNEPMKLSEVVERLLLFAPPLNPPHAWMRRALPQLGRLIQRWAGTAEPHEAMLRFFRAHDEDQYGKLSTMEMVQGLKDLELSNIEDFVELVTFGFSIRTPAQLDVARLRTIAQFLDSNGTGYVTYLGLVRALTRAPESLPRPELEQLGKKHTTTLGSASCADLLFIHRAALLRACLQMDIGGHGFVDPVDFVEAVKALGNVVGRPVTERQVAGLTDALGNTCFAYNAALNNFEVAVNRNLARQPAVPC